jgi:ferritin-like protein
MSRPLGSNNLKESSRQKAVRLLASGLKRDEVIKTLTDEGATENTAKQYYAYAKRQLTKENKSE